MTKDEALVLAYSYAKMHKVAGHEMENGCESAATCLREEAEMIEARLKEHGFDAGELLCGLLVNLWHGIDPKPEDGA